MTNAELFTSWQERVNAFRAYCGSKDCATCNMPTHNKLECLVRWLESEPVPSPALGVILPCPFCGDVPGEMVQTRRGHTFVRCPCCGARTTEYVEPKNAIKAWNTRG